MTNTALTESTEAHGVLRPNAKRAKNAITLLWIILILEFVSIFFNYLQYALLSSSEISEEAANTNDTRQQIFGVIYLICFIVSAVMFIRWFRRAYFNLSQKDEYLSHANKDTGICWFLPVINLEVVERYAKAEAVLAEIPDENNELDNMPAHL